MVDSDGVGPGLLAEPADADTDVDQRVLQLEHGLVAAVPGVPAEESQAALGDELGQVVLGEVGVVVRGDERDGGPAASRPMVEPLARMASVPGAGHRR